jgi:hypothetical protein
VPGPFGRASFFGAKRPFEFQVFECDPEKGVPFSGEIALSKVFRSEEEP